MQPSTTKQKGGWGGRKYGKGSRTLLRVEQLKAIDNSTEKKSPHINKNKQAHTNTTNNSFLSMMAVLLMAV